MAFACGSVLGQGVGQGAPVYIPIVHSDLIFPAIGEEWGLLGALSMLGCQAVLSVRALRLSIRQINPFRALLAAGIGITFAAQSTLIMAGAVKLLAPHGGTAAFVGSGGRSPRVKF